MIEIDLMEFSTRLYQDIMQDSSNRFSFFLGSGASVPSGIPSSSSLVRKWLLEIQKIKKLDSDEFERWANSKWRGVWENPSLYYMKVFEYLYPTPYLREKEIEHLLKNKVPSFGYYTLATLMAKEEFKSQLNVAISTNFDNFLLESFYKYTQTKPKFIYCSERLNNFLYLSENNPLIIKVQDRAYLFRSEVDETLDEILSTVSSRYGMIFIGYNGYNRNLTRALKRLPKTYFASGIYWINNELPRDKEFREWLEKFNAIWVRDTHSHYLSFDKVMMYLFYAFGLDFLDIQSKIHSVQDEYESSFEILQKVIGFNEKNKDTRVLSTRLKQEFKAWRYKQSASQTLKVSPTQSEEIYLKALEEIPDSFELLGNYASFLDDVKKDYHNAEEYYQKAIVINPRNLKNLLNYAQFLKDVRKDFIKAEEYYMKAIAINAHNADVLGKYANFLYQVKKDYEKAETHYLKAIHIDIDHAHNLTNYAIFLKEIRQDYVGADIYFKKSVEANPNDSIIAGNYALFLKDIFKTHGMLDENDKLDTRAKNQVKEVFEHYFFNYDKEETVFVNSKRIIYEVLNTNVNILLNNEQQEKMKARLLELTKDN